MFSHAYLCMIVLNVLADMRSFTNNAASLVTAQLLTIYMYFFSVLCL